MSDKITRTQNRPTVIMVTGATRGIGLALATELAERGHKVYGGGRSWTSDSNEMPFEKIILDVKEDDSVKAALARILDEQGRIDVLVNNAGVSHCGPVEETSLDDAQDIFETNYFGLMRTTQAVIPVMRNQDAGTIVNIGSAAGKIGIPFQAHYAASKFAIEGLSESLRYELLPFGIRVILIEPGDVQTDIWKSSEKLISEGSAYSDAMSRFLEAKDKEMGGRATPVEKVAKDIADIIFSGTTRLRHPVARMAGTLLFLRKILPDRIFEWAVKRNYGI